MARHASTYRQARRAVWKLTGLSWHDANTQMKVGSLDGLRFGPVRYHFGGPVFHDRSKYMPHIGKKQRAKGAARAA